jgi:hypothetical protein
VRNRLGHVTDKGLRMGKREEDERRKGREEGRKGRKGRGYYKKEKGSRQRRVSIQWLSAVKNRGMLELDVNGTRARPPPTPTTHDPATYFLFFDLIEIIHIIYSILLPIM